MKTLKFLIVTIGIFFICLNLKAQNCWEEGEFLDNYDSIIDSIEIIDIEYSNIPENDRMVVGMHLNGFPFIAGFDKQGKIDSTFSDDGGKVFLFEENLELIDFELNTVNGEIYALLKNSTSYFIAKLNSNGQYDVNSFGEFGFIDFENLPEISLTYKDIRLHNGNGVYVSGIADIGFDSSNTVIVTSIFNINSGELIGSTAINIIGKLNEITLTQNQLVNINRIDGKLFFTIIDEYESKSFGYIRVDEFGDLIETEDDTAIFEEGINYTFNSGVYHFPYEPIANDDKEFITHGTVSLNMAIPFKEETLGAIYMLHNFNQGTTTFTKKMFCLPSNADYLDFDIGDHSWSTAYRPIYFSGISNGNSFLVSSTDENFCFIDENNLSSIPTHLKSFNRQTISTEDSIIVFTENLTNDLMQSFNAKLYTKAQNDNTNCIAVSVELESQTLFDLTVFPNPVTSNKIEINFSTNSSGKIIIALYDLNGNQLLQNELKNHTNNNVIKEQLNLPFKLPKGVYLLKVIDNQSISSKKLIVQ